MRKNETLKHKSREKLYKVASILTRAPSCLKSHLTGGDASALGGSSDILFGASYKSMPLKADKLQFSLSP